MTHRRVTSATIPRHWTGEQAKAVVDFLEDIVAAIWDTHEENLLHSLKRGPDDQTSEVWSQFELVERFLHGLGDLLQTDIVDDDIEEVANLYRTGIVVQPARRQSCVYPSGQLGRFGDPGRGRSREALQRLGSERGTGKAARSAWNRR